MEHRTALALAAAVVMVGGSGAVALGTLTGAIGPDVEDLPEVGSPAVVGAGSAGERRAAAGRRPQVERVTRYVDVPVPAPAGPAAPPATQVPAQQRAQPPEPAAAAAIGGEESEEAAELLQERREERAERLEDRREERREQVEESREEHQDRLEDLREDDNSGHGGSGHG